MNKTLIAVVALVVAYACFLAFNPPPFLLKLMASTDVVAQHAKRSSAAMLTALPGEDPVKRAGEGWTFSSPDGTAEFIWNPARDGADGHTAALRTPAAPFLAAGMDPALLPDGVLRDGMLTFAADAEGEPGDSGMESPASAFAAVIDSLRDRVGYHFQLGHYGLELDNGALLEWAGELGENDLDLVFALDPELFRHAGADVNTISGWTLGTIIVHDASGKKVETPKLLKPFNLR